jgi:hypothetical protein
MRGIRGDDNSNDSQQQQQQQQQQQDEHDEHEELCSSARCVSTVDTNGRSQRMTTVLVTVTAFESRVVQPLPCVSIVSVHAWHLSSATD